jgi:hypothetical protein
MTLTPTTQQSAFLSARVRGIKSPRRGPRRGLCGEGGGTPPLFTYIALTQLRISIPPKIIARLIFYALYMLTPDTNVLLPLCLCSTCTPAFAFMPV